MSIENAVNEILSTGDYDECDADFCNWSFESQVVFGDGISRKMGGIIRPEDYHFIASQVFETLTARQHEQMQHYKAEAERADI